MRSSWLMTARNSDLARLALSACSLARLSAASNALRSVMSKMMPSRRPLSVGIEDYLGILAHPARRSVAMQDAVVQFERAALLHRLRDRSGDHLGVIGVGDAGVGADARVDEVGHRVSRQSLAVVADVDVGPIRIDEAAVDDAGNVGDQGRKRLSLFARATDFAARSRFELLALGDIEDHAVEE